MTPAGPNPPPDPNSSRRRPDRWPTGWSPDPGAPSGPGGPGWTPPGRPGGTIPASPQPPERRHRPASGGRSPGRPGPRPRRVAFAATSASNSSMGHGSAAPFGRTPSVAATVRRLRVRNTAAIAAKASPALVDIDTDLSYQGGEAAGTGIVLTSDGMVLTNNHVISGATQIRATDVGNGHTYTAMVVGYDRIARHRGPPAAAGLRPEHRHLRRLVEGVGRRHGRRPRQRRRGRRARRAVRPARSPPWTSPSPPPTRATAAASSSPA